MKSEAPGINTSAAEVTNISKHGIWVLIGEEELFLPYAQFPWFENAAIKAVLNLEQPHSEHLYWPDLDVDLTLESIKHPEKYPLMAK